MNDNGERRDKSHLDHILSEYTKINKLPLDQRRILRKVVDYAHKNKYYLGRDGDLADLWGFGSVSIIMDDPETDTQWVSLKTLVDPTGLEEDELKKVVTLHELLGDLKEKDIITLEVDLDKRICLVTLDFVYMIFMKHSPWSSLFQFNQQSMFLRNIYLSGDYEDVGVRLLSRSEDGTLEEVGETSLKEYFEEHGVPSEEDAIHASYRGLSVEVFDDQP